MMKKFALGLVLAATALAAPAVAKDQSWYVGVEAGPNLMQSQVYDVFTANGATKFQSAIQQNYFVGYDFGGNIGYDFGPFRAEFALNYNRNKVRRSIVLGPMPPINFSTPTNTAGDRKSVV